MAIPHTLRALRRDFDSIATAILGGSEDLSVPNPAGDQTFHSARVQRLC